MKTQIASANPAQQLYQLLGFGFSKLIQDCGILILNFLSDLHHAFSTKSRRQNVDLALIILRDLTVNQTVRNHAINQFGQSGRIHQNDFCKFAHGQSISGVERFQNAPCFDLKTVLAQAGAQRRVDLSVGRSKRVRKIVVDRAAAGFHDTYSPISADQILVDLESEFKWNVLVPDPHGKGASAMMTFLTAPTVPTELEELHDFSLTYGKGAYRIALLIPLCGSAGLWAPSCISSAQVAVEELNRAGGIEGRKIQLIMIDAALEANISIEETVNGLIEAGAIDAIVGMHISAIRQRLSKVVRQRIPYVYTPLYEGGESTAGLFAIGETPQEQLGPSIELLQNKYRPKSWALIGNDYVWPRTSHSFAKSKLKEMSVGLVYEKYLPFGIRNMARFVDEIAGSGAEAVLISLVGQDAVAFNRAFGSAGLHNRMVRLSCAVEENALMASGSRNSKRLFVASSYFAALPTDANAAFKELYYKLHGDVAPALNALGQSTYEGVHFLAGLMQSYALDWREHYSKDVLPVVHRSGRTRANSNKSERAPIYLARADGLKFEVIKEL